MLVPVPPSEAGVSMRKRVVALLFVGAALVLAAASNANYPWKNSDSFEIDRVDGVERIFESEAPISLEVFGRSTDRNVAPDPEFGFHVQAYIDHADVGRSISAGNGQWDPNLRGWRVELTAPAQPRDQYRLQVALYCGRDESLCAETYGRAAQVTSTFRFDVPEP